MGRLVPLPRCGRPATVILERPLEGSGSFNGFCRRLDVRITRRVGQAERGRELGHARDDAFAGRPCPGLVFGRCDPEPVTCFDRDGQEKAPGGRENGAGDAQRHTCCKGGGDRQPDDCEGGQRHRNAARRPEGAGRSTCSAPARLLLRVQQAELGEVLAQLAHQSGLQLGLRLWCRRSDGRRLARPDREGGRALGQRRPPPPVRRPCAGSPRAPRAKL